MKTGEANGGKNDHSANGAIDPQKILQRGPVGFVRILIGLEYEPYQAMNLAEVSAELENRIADEEMLAVELKSSGKLIGNVYLGKREFESLEIGYVFNKAYWGQGYAKESCEALIRKAFSEGIHRIYAECDPCNPNSWRLLKRMCFQKEVHLRQNVYFWKDDQGHPIWKDTFVYARLNGTTT